MSAELAAELQKLVSALPRFGGMFARAEVPSDGIYFFFERGETVQHRGRVFDRVVRVGTHRVDGRLPVRLRSHYSGNRRGSVFRRHLGAALLAKSGQIDAELDVWYRSRSARFPTVESEVTVALSERFSFCCVAVNDVIDRLSFERGLIALLSRFQLASPSEFWLGRAATRLEIRESGLWNTQHVAATPIGKSEFDRFREMAIAG
jgi:hypothetical protein